MKKKFSNELNWWRVFVNVNSHVLIEYLCFYFKMLPSFVRRQHIHTNSQLKIQVELKLHVVPILIWVKMTPINPLGVALLGDVVLMKKVCFVGGNVSLGCKFWGSKSSKPDLVAHSFSSCYLLIQM